MAGPLSDIQIFYLFRIIFNEFPSWLHPVAHQGGKGQIYLRGCLLIHGHAKENPALRIHGGLPKLLRIHLSQPLIALDLIAVVTADLHQDGIEFLIAVGIPDTLVFLDLI